MYFSKFSKMNCSAFRPYCESNVLLAASTVSDLRTLAKFYTIQNQLEVFLQEDENESDPVTCQTNSLNEKNSPSVE